MMCKKEIYNIFPGLTSEVAYERLASGVNLHVVTTLSSMAVEGTMRMCKQNIDSVGHYVRTFNTERREFRFHS